VGAEKPERRSPGGDDQAVSENPRKKLVGSGPKQRSRGRGQDAYCSPNACT